MYLIKRIKTLLGAAFVTASLWTAPAFAAGTLPLAMAQQIDINGQPLAGCQVYFFVAGTPASPQNSYSDFALSQNPQPILSCDQAGRVPMFWLADGLVHVRMTDAAGSPIIDTTMQVLGPSSGGGGGGGTVDPTTLMATGDMKARYGTGPLTGFVRTNGLTMGNATSGATERANADTQSLFIYLYTTDPNLVVSGGRTGNALNDFNASKTIALPDWSGQALAALDDQGAGPRGKLTTTYCGTSPTVLGAACGNQSATLLATNLPPYTPAGTVATTTDAAKPIVWSTGTISSATTSGGAEGIFTDVNSVHFLAGISATGTLAGTPAPGQNSTPFSIVQPTKLATIYLKL